MTKSIPLYLELYLLCILKLLKAIESKSWELLTKIRESVKKYGFSIPVGTDLVFDPMASSILKYKVTLWQGIVYWGIELDIHVKQKNEL